MPLKLFRATVANADIGSLKSFQTFLKMLLPYASEIRTKSYGPNYTKFFDKKTGFYNHFWQKVDAILEDVSVAKIIV